MKIILSSRRHHYVARVSTFLIAVALIAGIVGCGGGVVEYTLTITSTTGGSVTTPEEGTSTYDEGTVVNLVAEAGEGYRFVNWTGDVGTVDDVNDTTTTITMNGDYSITANFGLDEGLVAYWNFDEGSGNITHDSSSNNLSGDIVNPNWIPGISGSALNFTGGCYVVFEESPMNSFNASVEFWIKDDGVLGHTHTIFAKAWEGGLAYRCFIYANYGDYGDTLWCTQYRDMAWPWFAVEYTPDSTWKFYTITFEKGPSHFPLDPPPEYWTPYRYFDLHVYMNGEEVPIVIGDVGITILDSVAPFVIGRNERLTPGSQLGASLDEFKIYDRVLTPAEALEHYNYYLC